MILRRCVHLHFENVLNIKMSLKYNPVKRVLDSKKNACQQIYVVNENDSEVTETMAALTSISTMSVPTATLVTFAANITCTYWP